jgi:hypothetical protein
MNLSLAPCLNVLIKSLYIEATIKAHSAATAQPRPDEGEPAQASGVQGGKRRRVQESPAHAWEDTFRAIGFNESDEAWRAAALLSVGSTSAVIQLVLRVYNGIERS